MLALLVAASAAAQPAPSADALVRAMDAAVERLDYEEAEARAREALARCDALTRCDALSPDQLVEVHTTLGVLLHTRGEPVEARRQFEAALSIAPDLRLDPVLVSPKTVEFFDGVRAAAAPRESPAGPQEIRYVVVPDPRPAAALRSLVVPGWGQFYKGDRGKGWAFVVTAGALAAGTAAAHLVYLDADRDYTQAGRGADFAALNARRDRWYTTRGVLVRGAAAVWGAAALDALVSGGPEATRRARGRPRPGGSGAPAPRPLVGCARRARRPARRAQRGHAFRRRTPLRDVLGPDLTFGTTIERGVCASLLVSVCVGLGRTACSPPAPRRQASRDPALADEKGRPDERRPLAPARYAPPGDGRVGRFGWPHRRRLGPPRPWGRPPRARGRQSRARTRSTVSPRATRAVAAGARAVIESDLVGSLHEGPA